MFVVYLFSFQRSVTPAALVAQVSLVGVLGYFILSIRGSQEGNFNFRKFLFSRPFATLYPGAALRNDTLFKTRVNNFLRANAYFMRTQMHIYLMRARARV